MSRKEQKFNVKKILTDHHMSWEGKTCNVRVQGFLDQNIYYWQKVTLHKGNLFQFRSTCSMLARGQRDLLNLFCEGISLERTLYREQHSHQQHPCFLRSRTKQLHLRGEARKKILRQFFPYPFVGHTSTLQDVVFFTSLLKHRSDSLSLSRKKFIAVLLLNRKQVL